MSLNNQASQMSNANVPFSEQQPFAVPSAPTLAAQPAETYAASPAITIAVPSRTPSRAKGIYKKSPSSEVKSMNSSPVISPFNAASSSRPHSGTTVPNRTTVC